MKTNSARSAPHVARVLRAPVRGVHVTHLLSGHHFGRHWHDTYGVGLLEHGAQSWSSGRGEVRAYAGDVISTNPGEVHDGRPLGGPTRRWQILHVAAASMTSLIGYDVVDTEIVHPVVGDNVLAGVLHRLFRRIARWHASSRESAAHALACEESLVESCVLLMARHGTARPSTIVPSSDVDRVRTRLADAPLDPPTLSELATMTGLSKYQVLRRFEKAYGLPPHAWLQRHRAELARVMIRDGASLAATAAATGFADQSHMTRVFARQYGFTPGAWQKAVALQ